MKVVIKPVTWKLSFDKDCSYIRMNFLLFKKILRSYVSHDSILRMAIASFNLKEKECGK